MIYRSFCFAALVSCFLTVTPTLADWTSYLNGNDRAGYTSESVVGVLTLAWTRQAPAKPRKAWAGPRSELIEGHEMRHRVDFDAAMQVVVSDGRVYYGSSVDHTLYCVDADTGETIWDFYTEGAIRLAPTLAHGNVYVGSDDGFVYCLNREDGEVVWKMRVGPREDLLLARGEMIARWPVRTGVLIDGDTAFFGAGIFPHENVYLCAVNAHDGSIVWRNDAISQQDAGRNDLSPQGYLLASEDHLFVPSGRSLPVAVSKKTGEIVFKRSYSWRTTAGGVVGGTKALLGDGQIYAGGPHHFLAMDQVSGNVGEAYINGRQMVLADDMAYLVDGERVFSVNRAEHAQASQEKQKWFLKQRDARRDPEKLAEARRKIEEFTQVGIQWQYKSDLDDVLIATENLVVAGGENQVIALDRSNGRLVWQSEVDGNVRGLAADQSLLLVSTDAGTIYAFRSDQPDRTSMVTTPKIDPNPFPADEWTEHYKSAAEEILQQSGQRTGYCLVAGSEQGRLAYELARQSELQIIGVEPDPDKAAASRASLTRAGLHGTRVTIFCRPLGELPFSNYFANLIVSDSMLLTGQVPDRPEHLARHLKPCGGVAMVGRPKAFSPIAGEPIAGEINSQATIEWLSQWLGQDEGDVISQTPWYLLRRGKLAGAGDWSHQYGNVANTSSVDDYRVRDGLGVLWYGDPGPSAMINRHEAAGAPLSTNGRMFIQGTDRLMAYDAYNGNFLWDLENPGAVRTGVFNNRETHNLAASDDALYVAIHSECMALDAATGQVTATYQTPESPDGIERAWAYLAYDNGQLFGTSTIREELEARMRRRGLKVKSQTDAVFAVDTETGKRMWTYRGDNILHTTIAIGPDRVYFIDSSISPEERMKFYLQDKGDLKQLEGEAAAKAEAEAKAYDIRRAVAIDRRTGEKLWSKPVDVTDTTNISAGGGSLTLMYAKGHVVLCGANANGHYWKQFLAGEFDRRKLIVLDATDGSERWSKNANYMNRPAIIGNEIFAEPWAFELTTGKPKMRPHPLTGEESQWRFSRPGHHCGVITATPNMMFFRSGFIGYYDLYRDSGTRHFAGQRLGCWINAIPGNGLVMIPEASAGCVCQFSIASTVVMEPKVENKSWGILSAVGPKTPVNRIGINFGAPGDRKDLSGREWFGYPRPATRNRLEFVFDLKPKLANGGGWYSRNVESVNLGDVESPWLLASGGRALQRFEIPLLGKGDDASSYDVKFYFANLESSDSAAFEIRVQSQTVRSGVVLEGASSGRVNIDTIELPNVQVEENLVVEFQFSEEGEPPVLSAIEVTRNERTAR